MSDDIEKNYSISYLIYTIIEINKVCSFLYVQLYYFYILSLLYLNLIQI